MPHRDFDVIIVLDKVPRGHPGCRFYVNIKLIHFAASRRDPRHFNIGARTLASFQKNVLKVAHRGRVGRSRQSNLLAFSILGHLSNIPVCQE